MAHRSLAAFFRNLRQLVGPRAPSDPTDDQLLERFVVRQDEDAFAALVSRHGPLVLGVCRQVLRDAHAAEDAFQAVFLVLARKAAAIRQRQALGSWLYRVAYHLAVNAKAQADRRRARESEAMAQTQPAAEGAADPDAWPLLHEEVQRLPEKYRRAVVLCYFEGKSNEQAAGELGWTKDTVRGRLFRARDLLRERLSRRGVALGLGLLGTVTAGNAVSAELAQSTVHAAVLFAAREAMPGVSAQVLALTEGALRTMFLSKLKSAVAILAVLLVLTGSGWLLHHALAQKPAPADPPTPPVAAPKLVLPDLPASFTQVQALIKPRADESQVERIPWLDTLWEARSKAAAAGKPIFIWVTGGPPGGC